MHLTREVIVDLLPVYYSGEASLATRRLVEDYLKQDPELAQRIKLARDFERAMPASVQSKLELRALKRTRRVLFWQRWVFGLALFFTAIGFSFEYSTRTGHLQEFHFLVRDYPGPFAASLVCALVLWVLYFYVRHHMRGTGF